MFLKHLEHDWQVAGVNGHLFNGWVAFGFVCSA